MGIKEIFPIKSHFRKGESIEIVSLINTPIYNSEYYLICNIYRFHELIHSIKKVVSPEEEQIIFTFQIEKQFKSMAGFGVNIELWDKDGIIDKANTAFDILESWNDAPRYGFLADFFQKDRADDEDLKEMNKLHLNVVQFYDWMYRHHELIPKENKFVDPLGRELSLDVVKEKIDFAHKYGMKAMAYGAVYGACKEFYEEHKDWALYKNDGEVQGLDNFLYIMDINSECRWHDHIIEEFLNAIKLGFDGIHMDQYGFPKSAVSKINNGEKIRYLRDDFPALINDTKKHVEDNGYGVDLIFNAVNNWPVDTVAKSKEDAVYIEVWPPNDTYQDLYNLICNAKKYAPEKQVILAAYMKPFLKDLNLPIASAENATLLTMATIFASGGFHLLLGENSGILDDPYYPNYRVNESEEFRNRIKNYYDFIVKYEELLFDFDILDCTMVYTGGINGEYVLKGGKFSPKAEKGHIWTLIKEKPSYKIINLVNFRGLKDMNWNEGKENAPDEIKDIEITALVNEQVKGVYIASPDIELEGQEELNFQYVTHGLGKAIRFTVPLLRFWNLIYIELD